MREQLVAGGGAEGEQVVASGGCEVVEGGVGWRGVAGADAGGEEVEQGGGVVRVQAGDEEFGVVQCGEADGVGVVGFVGVGFGEDGLDGPAVVVDGLADPGGVSPLPAVGAGGERVAGGGGVVAVG
nr:hypothetical protein [Frankia sp. QA3]